MDDRTEQDFRNLCTDSTFIRGNYYSRTHRASFTIEDQTGEWDITHIELPFPPRMEAEYMRRFNVSRDDLPEVYRAFSRALRNHLEIAKEFSERSDCEVTKAAVIYRLVKIFTRTNGSGAVIHTDVYMVTEPMTALMDTPSFGLTGTTLKNIGSLSLSLLRVMKEIHAAGYALGGFDLDSLYVSSKRDGHSELKTGFFFYSSKTGTETEGIYPPDARMLLMPGLLSGEVRAGADTDTYSLCRLLWTLYDGQRFDSGPDLSCVPGYASPGLADALKQGLETGAAALPLVEKSLNQLNTEIESNQRENEYVVFIPPLYLGRSLPGLRKQQDGQNPDGTVPEQKPAGYRLMGIIAALILSACLCIVIGLRISREQAHDPLPPSSEAGLYARDGTVVDRTGKVSGDYSITDTGELIECSGGNILFSADLVTPFIPVDKINTEYIGREYRLPENPMRLFQIKPEAVNLLDEDFRFDAAENAENEVPPDLVLKYGINEKSLLIMKSGEQTVYTAVEEIPSGDENTPPRYRAVIPEDGLTERDMKLALGTWEYKLILSVSPEKPTNPGITVTTADPGHLYFAVEKDGKAVYAKSVSAKADESGRIELRVIGKMEGNFGFLIESEDGALKRNEAVSFYAEEDQLSSAAPPAPSPLPEPAASPVPTPVPTPLPSYIPASGTHTVYVYVTPSPVPTVQPAPSPEPVPVTFACDASELAMNVGERKRIFPSESCTISFSSYGIVEVNPQNFEITAVGEGECDIILTCTLAELKGQVIIIHVLVSH